MNNMSICDSKACVRGIATIVSMLLAYMYHPLISHVRLCNSMGRNA